jgi:hypothetical protein
VKNGYPGRILPTERNANGSYAAYASLIPDAAEASHLNAMASINVIPRDGLTEYVISGSTKGEVAEGVYRIRLSYPGCRITEDPPVMDRGHIRTHVMVEVP